jgi:hypothetical protein
VGLAYAQLLYIAVTTTRQTVHELLQHADTVQDEISRMDVDMDAPCRHPLSQSLRDTVNGQWYVVIKLSITK